MSSYETTKTTLSAHKTTCGGRIVSGSACFKCEDCREQLSDYIDSDYSGIEKEVIVEQIIDAINNDKRTVLTGWICPICGAGVSPHTHCCICVQVALGDATF